MKLHAYLLWFICMTLFISGCSSSKADVNTPKKYFDLIQFVENQAEILQEENPKVEKHIKSADQDETKTVQIEKWETELAPFSECDINVPILQDAYTIEETHSKIVYTAKTPELKVRKIHIEKTDNQVTKLKLHYKTESQFYYTERFPEMELENGKLKRYFIKGSQKVLLKDANGFEITGTLK